MIAIKTRWFFRFITIYIILKSDDLRVLVFPKE